MLAVGLIVLQAFCAALCAGYDQQLDGLMRPGNSFLRRFNNEASSLTYINRSERRLIQNDERNKIEANVKKKLYKMENFESTSYVSDFIDYLKSKRKQRIVDDMKNILKKDLKIDKIISFNSRNAYNGFNKKLDDYVDRFERKVINVDLDVEFFLLDIVYITNEMLYHIQNKIFNETIEIYGKEIFHPNVEKILTQMSLNKAEYKKQDMEYVCVKYDICRPCPGFTDYFTDLIKEILTLPSDKMGIIIDLVTKLLSIKIDFFKRIMHVDILNEIVEKFTNTIRNIFSAKEFLHILSTAFIERHRCAYNEKESTRNITKSIKILLDIVDKAFDKDGNEMVAMNFDNLLDGIKHWTDGSRNDIEINFTLFINYFIDTLKYNLSHSTKEEVKVLIGVLMKRRLYDTTVTDYLYTKGSQFVRGIDRNIFDNEI